MGDRSRARLEELQGLLRDAGDGNTVIDIKALRTFCHHGIPDKAGMRSMTWKLLLNYLPLDRAEWGAFLGRQRQLYAEFVQEFIVNTHTKVQPGHSSAAAPPKLHLL